MKKYKIIQIQKLLILSILLPLFIFLVDHNGYKAQAQPPIYPPGLDVANDVLKANTPFLLENPEVVGTAVGLDEEGKPVIKVFALTNQYRGIPRSLHGFPVDVEVTGMFIALSDPTARFDRPVPIGISTGHPDITAGTIGCRVTDGTNVFALSNNHVYANTNDANIGDNVLQPGTYDGGSNPADAIGTLYDFEPIKFDGSDNHIDAAIALSSLSYLGNATPSDDGYGKPSSISETPSIGMQVKKYGRTTGLTYGEITGLNATVNVCYECAGPFCFSCKKLAKFVSQYVVEPGGFSAGGDSGSLIVTDDSNNNPVGLLFAGSSTHTIANDIDSVFNRFGVFCDDGLALSCSDDADCGDSNVCNGAEVCVDGNCETGTSLNCDDADACTADSCDPENGCINEPINCDDGDDCTADSCDTVTGCVNEPIPDCSSSCSPVGAFCSSDAECCSNKCRGRPGAETCK